MVSLNLSLTIDAMRAGVSEIEREPVYEEPIHDSVRSSVEPVKLSGSRPTYTVPIELAGTKRDVVVKPATEHWAIYFMDTFNMAKTRTHPSDYDRFMRSHIPMFADIDDLGKVVYMAVPKLIRAVAETTERYYSEDAPAPKLNYLQ